MKILCKCGEWYLNAGETCPKCGYTLTSAEGEAVAKAQATARKNETKEERKERLRREWGDYNSRENIAARAAADKARAAADKEVVSAVLISTTNKRSAFGTVARATVGGAFFGLAGAIGGAASTKSEATHATFSVKYASGRVATETVPVNSARFRELSAFLHQ